MTNRSLDEVVATLASKQYGSFTRQQVLEQGGSKRAVQRRIQSGQWLKRGDGLYVLPSAVPCWTADLRTALLAHGPDSVISHRAGAALHTWPAHHPGLVELTAPGAPNYRGLGTMHRTKDLYPEDITCVRGFPVTTELRTAVDMASLARKSISR